MSDLSDRAVPGTIVVPLDGSDYALRASAVAAGLATAFDADLVLMTTPQTLDPVVRSIPPPWLDQTAREVAAPRVHTRYVASDDPASAIAEVAHERPNTSVCMSTHGRGRAFGLVLGHVAERVLTLVDAPTVLVGPHDGEWRIDEPMLVCHDGSLAADAILEPARLWARKLGLPLVLLHGLHSLDAESDRHMPSSVTKAAETLGAGTPLRVCRGSYPASALRLAIDELRPSMLALSTHGRTGLARVTLGSVAIALVRSSPCPVLLVRPSPGLKDG